MSLLPYCVVRNLIDRYRYLLRRTALRALSSAPPTSLTTKPRTFTTFKSSFLASKQQWTSPLLQRRFASEDAKPSEATTTDETVPERPSEAEKEIIEESRSSSTNAADAGAQPQTAAYAASESTDAAETAQNPSSSSSSSTLESAQQTASDLTDSAATTAQQAGETVAESAQQAKESAFNTAQQLGQAAGAAVGSAGIPSPFNHPNGRPRPLPREAGQSTPHNILYIGNLYFEVREDMLRREFSRFGNVVNSRVVYDNRGLSKGYASRLGEAPTVANVL